MSRVPPTAIPMEQNVLGSVLLAPESFWQVADQLTADDFYRHDHAAIWTALREAAEANRPIDMFTIADALEGRVEATYVTELACSQHSAANILAYAEIVVDRAKQRRLIEVGTRIVNDGFDGRDVGETVADATQGIADIGKSAKHRLKSVNDGLGEMVEAMQARMEVGEVPGTSYGLPSLDYFTGGKKPGDLIIIAARPSMGKTTLALQGAIAAGRPLIFSFETMASALLARMTAHVGQFPLRWITQPADAPEEAMSRVVAAAKVVKQRYTGSIYDGRRISIDQLRAIAIREHANNPVREIVVDHLGYMRLAGKGRTDQELGEVTKGLKDLAKELDVPVVLLMQLNRGVEGRADKRPMLSDLREAGSAEEDADVVAMLYRDGYYNPQSPIRDFCEIFLRKNRDGEPGECWARSELAEMRFDAAEPQTRPGASVTAIGGHGGIASRGGARGQSPAFSVAAGVR